MAEKLFQFLLKLKEDGVDLSEVQIWFNPACYDPSGYLDPEDPFSYNSIDKKIMLTEK